MDAKEPDAPGREPPAFEAEPDAWERFEKAVGKVVKAPPQHRTGKPPRERDAPAVPRKDKE